MTDARQELTAGTIRTCLRDARQTTGWVSVTDRIEVSAEPDAPGRWRYDIRTYHLDGGRPELDEGYGVDMAISIIRERAAALSHETDGEG